MTIPALLLLLALQDDARPPCAANIGWMNDGQRIVTRDSSMIPLTLFSAISQPPDCIPAEIRMIVTYFDSEDNFLCSGVIESVVVQTTHAQTMTIEIRPWNMLEYARWRNGPRPTAVRPRRLMCMNPDGLAEVSVTELDRATSLRIHATALPQHSGVSTAEIRFRIQP
jgi:hypothetical protein